MFRRFVNVAKKPLRKWRTRRRVARQKRSINCTGQAAHDYVQEQVLSGKPFMACRFGSNELLSVLAYANLVASYRKGRPYIPSDYAALFHNLGFQAGFFPITPDYIARFYHRMMDDIREIDILGSWRPEELDLAVHLQGVVRVELHDLDPVIRQCDRPWTSALRGKRVLVVHPFAKSIRSQYAKRSRLFDNPETLPEFELLTLQAIQNPAWTFSDSGDGVGAVGALHNNFRDWFEALEYMEAQISALEFDIAIIGCGAYGLPLAAHVKRLGRQAVHLGGITQMLFGIKGDRWIKEYWFSHHNEHWVWPLPEETPQEWDAVEKRGTYWGSE